MSAIEIGAKARRGLMGRAEALVALEMGRSMSIPIDDLYRNVFCILGLPVDAVDIDSVLDRIDDAVANRSSLFLSTPNANFLANSLKNPEFRETLLNSDLCPADGMPIVWIARLIGAPIKSRVSGADIFRALQAPQRVARQLTVFFFGGEEGVAEEAEKALNRSLLGLRCVGTMNPGFAAVEDLPTPESVARINASRADFLVAALGAQKGQIWLHRNQRLLNPPVRAHLGAAINFQAGILKRAPRWLQICGLEWAWRIKEEPTLWKRYARDAAVLFRLAFMRVLPLMIISRYHSLKSPGEFSIKTERAAALVAISLHGKATAVHTEKAIGCFGEIVTSKSKLVVLDLSNCRFIDARFFGLLLMFRKKLKEQGTELRFTGTSAALAGLFRLNELGFLLSTA